jgi:hypothetical protein
MNPARELLYISSLFNQGTSGMEKQSEHKSAGLRGLLTLNLATFSELTGLILALQFVNAQKPLAAIAVLILSQLSERIAVFLAADVAYAGRPFPPNFYALTTLSGIVESAAWIVWFILWDWLPLPGPAPAIIAAVAMFVMQLYSHSWTMSFVLNKPPFSRYASNPLNIAFSAVEALGAGAWLLVSRSDKPVLAGIVIFLALTIEHVIQSVAIEGALPPNFIDAPSET